MGRGCWAHTLSTGMGARIQPSETRSALGSMAQTDALDPNGEGPVRPVLQGGADGPDCRSLGIDGCPQSGWDPGTRQRGSSSRELLASGSSHFPSSIHTEDKMH